MEDKVLPHNLDAEMSVLGQLLVGDSHVWDEVHGYLSAEDFYKPAHSLIFKRLKYWKKKETLLML